MRGGLVTTDMEGRVVLLNRTGEEILGRTFAELRGRDLREVSAEFCSTRSRRFPEKLSLRREIECAFPGAAALPGNFRCPRCGRSHPRRHPFFNFLTRDAESRQGSEKNGWPVGAGSRRSGGHEIPR